MSITDGTVLYPESIIQSSSNNRKLFS